MSRKRAPKPVKKAKDLSAKELNKKQATRVKGGKRIVLFVVPPKEITSK
jgi:hypothetical protein